jgi:MFS family permease
VTTARAGMTVNRRRLLLALLIFSGVLNYADRQIIAVLKPLLQDELHWSDQDYGHLTAIFQFAAAFAYVGAGWVVDRIGWRRANVLAVGAWSLAAMGHAFARTLGQFTLARVALGATESLGTPTAIKTIAVLFEAKGRSAALGAMNAAGNIGAIITPLFVPTLALSLGWAAAFLIMGAIGLVWVALWWLALPQAAPAKSLATGGDVSGAARARRDRTPDSAASSRSDVASDTDADSAASSRGDVASDTDADSAASSRSDVASDTDADSAASSRGDVASDTDADSAASSRGDVASDANAASAPPVRWRTVLTDRRTWAIAGGKVLSDQVWWFLLFWAPDFFHREFNLDMQGFAIPLAVVYCTAALGSLIGGWISGRLIAGGMGVTDARKATMLVCALLVTPVPLALWVDNYWFAVALLSLTLAAHQGFSVNLFALTTDVTPSSRVATVISVAALFGNLSGMVILQVAGWLIGSGYGYGPLFGLAAVAYLLALGWVRLLLPKGSNASAALVA